jgi:hypothetical protein
MNSKKPRPASATIRCTGNGIAQEITVKMHRMPTPSPTRTESSEAERETILFTGCLRHELKDGTAKERFLKSFYDLEAEKKRHVAFYGLVENRYENELAMICQARRFHESFTAGTCDESDVARAMSGFAIAFAELVAKRDAPAFSRMLKIIEGKNQLPESERGGIGTENRYMLEKFCDLYMTTGELPTKMALRVACGLNDKKKANRKAADKRMKELGLAGLPTASR